MSIFNGRTQFLTFIRPFLSLIKSKFNNTVYLNTDGQLTDVSETTLDIAYVDNTTVVDKDGNILSSGGASVAPVQQFITVADLNALADVPEPESPTLAQIESFLPFVKIYTFNTEDTDGIVPTDGTVGSWAPVNAGALRWVELERKTVIPSGTVGSNATKAVYTRTIDEHGTHFINCRIRIKSSGSGDNGEVGYLRINDNTVDTSIHYGSYGASSGDNDWRELRFGWSGILNEGDVVKIDVHGANSSSWSYDYSFISITAAYDVATNGTGIDYGEWTLIGSSGAPGFKNGWRNYGSSYQYARYKISGNVVYIEGLIKLGTMNKAAFILPGGLRPSRRLIFGPETSGSTQGRVDILNTGEVKPVSGSRSWISICLSFTL